ncbi:MAG TPA: hypothetical protein VHP58_03940 [Alphaproteobacteria bacterium]|nr:hypothetical protein [Alphaproteobacteria bacterium]
MKILSCLLTALMLLAHTPARADATTDGIASSLETFYGHNLVALQKNAQQLKALVNKRDSDAYYALSNQLFNQYREASAMLNMLRSALLARQQLVMPISAGQPYASLGIYELAEKSIEVAEGQLEAHAVEVSHTRDSATKVFKNF